jgi:isopenicillin N synthase-like dioxygenase
VPSVPVIDIGGWGASAARDEAIAAQVDAACLGIGFFAISGHHVAPAIIAAMLSAADGFFALPEEEKKTYRPSSPDINRGYAAKGTEALSLSLGVPTHPDLFEAFNVGPERWLGDSGDPEVLRKAMFAVNTWPTHPAGFRQAVSRYFENAAAQAAVLLEIFAVALDLERDFFAQYTGHSTDTMRINYFQRSPGQDEPLDGQQRMGAHTDYGMVTVLYADSVPGLQVVGPDGQWQPVTPEPGTLLVNLGDLMAEWTNDRWKSSLHRVVPPPRLETGPALRRSVAFFRDGNYDALVECLPSCTGAGNPPRYAPVLAGEHLRAKVLGPRTQEVSNAMSTAGDRIAAVRPKPS